MCNMSENRQKCCFQKSKQMTTNDHLFERMTLISLFGSVWIAKIYDRVAVHARLKIIFAETLQSSWWLAIRFEVLLKTNMDICLEQRLCEETLQYPHIILPLKIISPNLPNTTNKRTPLVFVMRSPFYSICFVSFSSAVARRLTDATLSVQIAVIMC